MSRRRIIRSTDKQWLLADLRFGPFLAARKAAGKTDAVKASTFRSVVGAMINRSDQDGSIYELLPLFAEESDTTTRTVKRVIAILRNAGLMEKDEARSRGWAPQGQARACYRIDWDALAKLRDPETPARAYDRCFEGQPEVETGDSVSPDPPTLPPETGDKTGETGDRIDETGDKTDETGDKSARCIKESSLSSQKNTQQQPPEVTGADVGGDSEGTVSERRARMDAAAAALESLGVGEPTRSRLARIPQVTKSLISGEAIKLNDTNKGVGVLIRNIEAKAGQMKQLTEKAEKRAQRDAAQEAEKTGQRQQAGDEAAEIAAENAAVRAVIEAMTPAEIEDLRTEILENCQIGHICKQVRAADCDFRIPGLRPQVLPIVGGRLYAEEPT